MVAVSEGLQFALYLMVTTATAAAILWFLAGFLKGGLANVIRRHGGAD